MYITFVDYVQILSNILLSSLTPDVEEIIGDHQCGFRCNRSTTDLIFCIHLILQKKWKQSEAVHQLFIGFKKGYESVRMEILYNILIEFGIPVELVRLIKMCLNETCSIVQGANICLTCFLLRMVCNKTMAYCHCFSNLLHSMP